jgi:arsenate reductase
MSKTSTTSPENFFTLASKKIQLPELRKKILLEISKSMAKEYIKTNVAHVNFICTHNSRRSQLGQVWAYYAAHYFNLNIHAFSGGTEITAFYRNTLKTLQSVGFDFEVTDFSHDNPKYLISFQGSKNSVVGFSKRFDNALNIEPYIAITTCNNADKNCPFIPSALARFHLPFEDPKASDHSPEQEATYLKTSEQIAAEVFFIFTEVKNILP